MIKGNIKLVDSNDEVNYYVTYADEAESIRYGIYAELKNEKTDCGYAEQIYFTEAEANLRCKWLCKNNVYPITICDVLRNVI